MKKYKDLSFVEKKIVSRMYAAQKEGNKYSFPIFVVILIACYFISEHINEYIIVPFIIITIVWYIAHEIIVRKWYKDNNIKVTKKDIILFGTDYEINLEDEKGKPHVKKKPKKNKSKRTKKNI